MRLVIQQHFHPCAQRRMDQARNWMRAYYLSTVCFNNTVSRSNVTVFSCSCSVCISYSFCCQYPSVTCSPENSTLGSLSRKFLPINSSAGEMPVIVCWVTRYWNRKSWTAFRRYLPEYLYQCGALIESFSASSNRKTPSGILPLLWSLGDCVLIHSYSWGHQL